MGRLIFINSCIISRPRTPYRDIYGHSSTPVGSRDSQPLEQAHCIYHRLQAMISILFVRRDTGVWIIGLEGGLVHGRQTTKRG